MTPEGRIITGYGAAPNQALNLTPGSCAAWSPTCTSRTPAQVSFSR